MVLDTERTEVQSECHLVLEWGGRDAARKSTPKVNILQVVRTKVQRVG